MNGAELLYTPTTLLWQRLQVAREMGAICSGDNMAPAFTLDQSNPRNVSLRRYVLYYV